MPMTYFLMTFSLLVTSIYKKKRIKNTFFSNYLNIANLVISLIGAIFQKCYCSLSFKEMERIHFSEFINLCCEYYFLLDIVAFLILLVSIKFTNDKCKYFQLLLCWVKYLVGAMFFIILLATLICFMVFLVPLIIHYVLKVSPEYHSLFETFFCFISFTFFFSTVIGVVVAVAMCKLNFCVEAQTSYKEMRFYRQYLICRNNKSYNSDINTEVMRLRGGSKTTKDSDSKLRKKRKLQESSGAVSRSTSSVRSVGRKKTMKNDGVQRTAVAGGKSKQETSTDSDKQKGSRKTETPPKSMRFESSERNTSKSGSRMKTPESQPECPCDPEEIKKNKDSDGDLEVQELMYKRNFDGYRKQTKHPDADIKKMKDPDTDLKKKKDPNADIKEDEEPDVDHKKKKGFEAETKKKWDTDLPSMKEESSRSSTEDTRRSDSTSKAEKVTDAHIKSKRESSRSGKKPGRERTPYSSDESSSNESKTSQDSGSSESGLESGVDIVKPTKYGPQIKKSTDKSPKYKKTTNKTIPKPKGGSDHVDKRSVGTWKKGSAKDKPNIIKFKGPKKPWDTKMSASDMIIAERPEILTSDMDKIPSKHKQLQAYIFEPHKLKQFPDESDAVLKEGKGETAPKEVSKHEDQMVEVPCPVWSRKPLPKRGLWDSNVLIVQCPDCQGIMIDDTRRKKDLLRVGRGLGICKCPPTTPFILPDSVNSESESDEPKRGKKRWSSMFSRQISKTKQTERKKETPRGGHEGYSGLVGRGGKDGEALVLYKRPTYQSGQKQKGDGRKLSDVDSEDHVLDIQTDVVLRVNVPNKKNTVPDDVTSGLACFFDPKILPVSFDEPSQVVRCGKWRHGTFTETVSTRQAVDSGELVKSMRYTKSLFKSASRRNLTGACECATQARPSEIGINVDVDIVSPIGRVIGKPVHMQLDNQLTKLKLPCDCDHCRSSIAQIGPSKAQELDYKLRHSPSRCSPM